MATCKDAAAEEEGAIGGGGGGGEVGKRQLGTAEKRRLFRRPAAARRCGWDESGEEEGRSWSENGGGYHDRLRHYYPLIKSFYDCL